MFKLEEGVRPKSGKTLWNIVGKNGCLLSITYFFNERVAQEIVDALNKAYEQGRIDGFAARDLGL